jgi:drug/metabolite transporter (DMT)-like permease
MKLNQEKEGEISIFIHATLWGLFPIITILSFSKLPPLVSLGASTLLATLFFAVILSVKKKWHEIKNKAALKNIFWAAFFIGILFYVLFYFGLRYTSAGNAGIIALTETFFSFLLFHVWQKDYIPVQHIIGSVLMVAGAFIVLYPNASHFQFGDILILSAAFIAPFGNFFQQRARKIVSSESIMFVRSLISTIVIFLLVYISKASFSYYDFKNSFIFILINGVFMFGFSKILWIEGIHRISVTKSNALSGLSPPITLLFAWIFLRNSPTVWQLFSFIPMFLGVVLLSMSRGKSNNLIPEAEIK